MRRNGVWLALLGVTLVMSWAVAAPVSAATTEEVLAKLTKQRGEVKTFEFDMKTIMKGEQAGTSTGHMAMQVVMKDGKPAGALMNVKQQMTMGEMTHDTLMVNDGEFLWMETKAPSSGRVMVMKYKPDTGANKNDPQEFTDQYDLKLVGEEDFDGQKCWVLEGTPKAKSAAPAARGMGRGSMGMGMQAEEPGKIRMSVGQKDLFVRRYIFYSKSGKEISETQMTNVRLNGKLDPALFKYTPPKGAMVMDMTKGMPSLEDLKKLVPQE